MKMMLFSLSVMFLLTLLSVSGFGYGDISDAQNYVYRFGEDYVNVSGDGVFYDEYGHEVGYYNYTAVSGGEDGSFVPINRAPQELDALGWKNSTGTYPLFWGVPAGWDNLVNFDYGSQAAAAAAPEGKSFVLYGAMGFVALVTVMMGIGALVGIKVFGTGESDFSVKVLFTGSFFITLWIILTAFTYTMFVADGWFPLYIGYMVLTFMFSVDLINIMVGVGGNED